jgi:phosphoribosylanthranilate isomerase
MSTRPLVKICGTTSPEDAELAASAGADYIGVILHHPPSPRNVSTEQARAIFAAARVPVVALTVNQPLDVLLQLAAEFKPAVLQLHGDETPELVSALKVHGLTVWTACSGDTDAVASRARAMTNAGADAVLLDARAVKDGQIVYGGTGHRADWTLARQLVDEGLRVVLAGGLTPENVHQAVATVQPWMVDIVSGVEASKGIKDPEKVWQFIAEATRLD